MDPENGSEVSVLSDLETLPFFENNPLQDKRPRRFSEAASDDTGYLDLLQSTMNGLEPPFLVSQYTPILPSSFAVDDARSQSPSPHPCASPNHSADKGYYHKRRPRDPLGKSTTFSPPKSSTNIVDLLALGGPDGTSTISRVQVLEEYNTNDPLEPPIRKPCSENAPLVSCSHAQISLSTNSPSDALDHDQIPSSKLLSSEISPQTLDIVWRPHEASISYSNLESDYAITPSMEPTYAFCTSSSNIGPQSTREAHESFQKLAPLLNSARKRNFISVLVNVLHECDDNLSLDDFYTMLYNNNPLGEIFGSAQNHFSTVSDMRGHELCGLVFEIFKNPGNSHGGLVNNPFLSTVNCHESLRTILAIKILSSTFRKVHDQSLTIPRAKFYKAYYIICQKLMYKHSRTTNSLGLQQTVIFSQSAMGRVIKSVYPTLMTKRLGKRGTSKAHYMGMTWNESFMDAEVLSLLDLEFSEIRDHFGLREGSKRKHSELETTEAENKRLKFNTIAAKPQWSPLDHNSVYSFVECSSSYPGFDFSPRSWRETPNSLPKHSEWAKGTMEKSLNVLKGYDIDFGPLQEGICGGSFSTDSFSSTVIAAVGKLSGISASKETFLHLYLAVILLIMPFMISSDQELSRVRKVQLRESVKTCIAQLESEVATLPYVDRKDLTKFTRILSKLTVLNEMTSCCVKKPYAKAVLGEMVRDLDMLSHPVRSLEKHSLSEVLSIRSSVVAMNAYDCEIKKTIPQSDIISTIQKMAKAVSDSIKSSTGGLENATNDAHMTPDIPFKVLISEAEAYHKLASAFPELVGLPMMGDISRAVFWS
ncbi:hypothetical protein JCM33374_g1637 [Metschnikowia sp. JCM 33374]|nr:hypothetical protein JCM33374_g1637 [Metschnikowia sp. JCM 33374]